jgi:hypothetical protein
MNWMSVRAKGVSASAIREILKVTEKPGIISLAGGLRVLCYFRFSKSRMHLWI